MSNFPVNKALITSDVYECSTAVVCQCELDRVTV